MAQLLSSAPTAPTFVGPTLLRDDAGLRVWRIQGQTKRLIVCFSGVGRDGDKSPPPPEFQRLSAQDPRDHLLFIADPARSWLNRPGIVAEITAAIEAEVLQCGATQVCTLGHSLGGFSAVVIPAFTKVDVAVALSPQFSVDPAIVPAERRWREMRDLIKTFTIGNADDYVRPQTHYFAIFGRHTREAPQRSLARPRPNLDVYVMPHTHHNTSQKLKAAGILDQVLMACFDLDRPVVEKVLLDHVQGRLTALPIPEGSATPHIGKTGRA